MKRLELRILHKDYAKYDGQTVKVCGWARTVRDSKNIGFIELNDGAFKSVQIIVEKDKLSNFDEVVKQNVGTSFEVEGKVIVTPNNKQPYEINADMVKILGECSSDYPLQKKGHTMEFLREKAYLRPRTNTFNAVFKIRSVAGMAIHSYFQENGYVYVNTPLITTTDCEGSDQMFKITTLNFDKLPKDKEGKVDMKQDLFGKLAYITGTGQLHGEAYATAFSKIYTFGPTFRTENSNTKTHANEFWMIEPEIAFCDLEQLMDIEEEMLKYVVKYVLDRCEQELKFLDTFIQKGLIEKLTKLVNSKFTRIDHKDVIKILKDAKVNWEFEPDEDGDIAKEHEKYITEYFNGPVFIKNWPKDIKAFYMKLNPDNRTVAAVDLEVPGAGELMGGSQREENYEKLIKRCEDMNVDQQPIDWFINLRKFGTVEHSGFGMGFERLLMYLTGMDNIRDVVPFPRTPKNCDY